MTDCTGFLTTLQLHTQNGAHFLLSPSTYRDTNSPLIPRVIILEWLQPALPPSEPQQHSQGAHASLLWNAVTFLGCKPTCGVNDSFLVLVCIVYLGFTHTTAINKIIFEVDFNIFLLYIHRIIIIKFLFPLYTLIFMYTTMCVYMPSHTVSHGKKQLKNHCPTLISQRVKGKTTKVWLNICDVAGRLNGKPKMRQEIIMQVLGRFLEML